jgi:hypothetical protein
LATGKAKRAAKILTSNQQQTLQGLAGTSFITRDHRAMAQPNKADFDVRKVLKRKKVSRSQETGWPYLSMANFSSKDAKFPAAFVLCASFQRR